VIDGEAAILQRGAEIIGEPLVILDQQEAHLPPPMFGSRTTTSAPRRTLEGEMTRWAEMKAV